MALTQITTNGIKDSTIVTADIADSAITGAKLAKPVDLSEDEKIRIGADSDLQLYHQTGVPGISHIKSHTSADFEIGKYGTAAGNVYVKFGSDDSAIFKKDGAVELYWDDAKRFETTTAGATVTGVFTTDGLVLGDDEIIKLGDSQDLQIYHEDTSHTSRIHAYADRVIDICYNETSSGLKKSFIECYPTTGSVSLSFASSTKLATTTGGINIYGEVGLNGSAGTSGQVLISGGSGSQATWGTAYTHPNHSGEVTSTADGAQVIASNVVDEDNLKVSNSPTNGYFLQAQSGNTGGMTWAEVAAGGATFTATTNGAVSEGDPLLVESDGKVKKVNQLSDGVSSELDIDTGSSIYAPYRRAYHPNTGWGYYIYRAGSYYYYKPIKSNGTTFTLGTAGSMSGADHMFSPAIGGNDDGKMGFAYISGDDAKLQVGSINSSTGAFSNDSGTISIDGDADYESVATIYCPNANRWVYFYAEDQSNETSRTGKYRIVDGTTVGSEKDHVDQDGSVGPYFRRPKTFFDSTTGRITIMGDSPPTNIIRYRTGIVGSDSVTWHSISGDTGSVSVDVLPQVMGGSHSYYDVIWVQDLDMFLGARVYNSKMYMYKGTFASDGTISWSFIEYLNNSSSESATGDVGLGYAAGKLFIVYRGSGDSTKYATVSVSSSGALSSWSINSINSNEPAGIEVIAFSKGRAIGLYRDESDDHIKGICKQFVSSDLEDKFVGIADANYADGATATVLCAGNVSDKHSSLSPGSKYYVSTTGTLSTTKANPEVFAGTAVSATTITVKN